MKTLVIGGTGQVGSLVVQGLAAKGAAVRVMSRSKDKAAGLPNGVELVAADLNDPTQARPGFDGVDAVFMVNAMSPSEANEGLTAVALARLAGVKRFVYMSVHRVDDAPYLPHFGAKIAIETAVRTMGAAWTILRPSSFFQNNARLKAAILEHGAYPLPLGSVGVHCVDIRDIADAAVNALTSDNFANRTYAIVGPRALTGPEAAEILGSKLGKPLVYAGDLDAWAKAMSAFLPAGIVFDVQQMYAFFQQKGLLATPEDLEDSEAIVGHPGRTYEDYATELAAAWQ